MTYPDFHLSKISFTTVWRMCFNGVSLKAMERELQKHMKDAPMLQWPRDNRNGEW